jgi:hypothetical protein
MNIFQDLQTLNKNELMKVRDEVNRLLFLNNSMNFQEV